MIKKGKFHGEVRDDGVPAADSAKSNTVKTSGTPRGKPPIAPKPQLPSLKGSTDGALLAASRSWAATKAAHIDGADHTTPTPQQLGLSRSVPALVSTPKLGSASTFDSKTSEQEQFHRDASSRLRDEYARAKTRNANKVEQGTRLPPPLPAPRRNDLTPITVLPKTKKPSVSPHRADRYRDQSLRMLSPHVTGESLANAIVGAHLAVSRSPARQRSPAPADRSTSKQRISGRSRTTSPRKKPAPMRATMRESESSESSDSGHRHRPKRHPHKHHEGERKKWRDRVTDEEIKRYSGWWAANRGLNVPLACPKPQGSSINQAKVEASYMPEQEVVNVVVRELWKRSRLPDQILREIWDLVDDRKIGSLNKEQFIVGVWLIEQKLRGHKLPHAIAQSVWQSVRRHDGVDVKIRVH